MSSRFSFHLLLWSCLLILLGVMGWLSHSMLDAEKRRLAETHQIRLVEQSRLALWRMDSLLASMIAGENNRSPGEYFQGDALAEARKEEGAMPDLSGFAKLYFQIDPRGNVSSPQKDRERLEYVLQLGRSGWGSRVVDAMKNLPRPASISAGNAVQPETAPPAEEAVQVTSVAIMDGREQQKNGLQQELAVESRKAFQQGMEDYNMRKNLSNSQQEYNVSVKVKKKAMEPPRRAKKEIAASGRLVVSGEVNGMESPEGEEECLDVAGSLKKTGKKLESGPGDIAVLLDMGAAALTLDGKMVQFEVHEQKANPVPVKESLAEMSVTRRDGFAKTPESYREFSISSLQPRWQQGKECFLTRRISDHGQVWVQGIWLDWGKLSAYLLESVADILPEATLSPADGREESYLTLAGIPAMLNPGNLPSMPANSMRTVWSSMAMAWFCGLLALCGVIGFMIGLIRLSERRAVFVSAVTHELRTPLTTFNMYTEMLSSGLVPKGREMAYVDILKNEAGRLTHLVDNVLSYARVEKNSVSLQPEKIPVTDLASAVIARISPRLAAAGMDSQLYVAPELQAEAVTADMTAVEQIVYNLADNAAKYACFDGSVLKVELAREKRFLVIRVEDEGKGISDSLKGKLFRPFSRSAEEAAGKQPGVGLGLALSRELARSMGGDLCLEESSHGCRFALRIPLSRA